MFNAFVVALLSPEVRTLAEILGEAGYVTCAMTDAPHLLRPVGVLRGFWAIVADEDVSIP
ncbi:MAG: hypothetical protein Kow0063_00010 [Anaerolineae bacterium]